MTENFEQQAHKLENSILTKSSDEAAKELSQALTPMNSAEYEKFVSLLANDTHRAVGTNSFDNDNGNARLFSTSDLAGADFVFPKPGQNLSSICKNDMEYEARKNITQKIIGNCVKLYSDTNNLADPDKIKAGEALIIPNAIW